MGGRLDATNVTSPRVALDHQHRLRPHGISGSTLAAIAAEKAGIIKPHRPVISGVEDAEAAAAIRRRAEECGAELLELKGPGASLQPPRQQGRYSFDLALGDRTLHRTHLLRCWEGFK